MPGSLYTTSDRVSSQLQLDMTAIKVTGRKSNGGFYSTLDTRRTSEASPATPHTPPSSPPRNGLATNIADEVVDLSSPSEDQSSESHCYGHQLLGPSMISPNDAWDLCIPQSPDSEYSDRSIETLRNSGTFTISAPKLPDLPKVQCVVCKDPNMILFNGTELACGHFAHKVCLKAAIKDLGGVHPSCVACGQDCFIKYPARPIADAESEGSEPSLCLADSKLELLGEKLIERDDDTAGPDTAPIQLRMFVHSQSSTQHEVLVKVSTPASAFEHWRYRLTPQDHEAARRLTSVALGVTSLSRSRINATSAGRLRLVSVMRDSRVQAKTVGYLFEHAVVLTQISADGFEELVHSVDLDRDDVEMKGTMDTLELVVGKASLFYKASRETIANWIAASRDLRLNFPLAQPGMLSGPYYIERCLLHLVICLPFEHLRVIPHVLSELGPLDRLGLVVSTPGGSCAWLGLHKTSWRGWEVIAREQYRSFDLFTAASKSILETADGILGPDITGVQKSVALIAGCPLTTTSVGRAIHVVGIGKYDVDFLSTTATRSGGQFYHANDNKELQNVLAGIAAAERAYTHNDVRLSLVTSPGVHITDVVGLDKRSIRTTLNTLEVSLGSLLAGQSRTVLFSVEGHQSSIDLPVLSDCQVRARSAITGRQQWETQPTLPGLSAEFHVFSERMARIAAAILSEGVSLVETGQTDELQMMLTRAVGAIKRAVVGFRANYKLHSQPLIELTDPDVTGVLAAAQAEILAHGLEELQRQIMNQFQAGDNTRAVLLQASFVLQNQRAVTRRTILEQVFQEQLETNKL